MPLRVDATPYSAVVICSDCPTYQVSAHDRLDGWRRAAGHEAERHPGQDQARAALRDLERRQAGRRAAPSTCTCPSGDGSLRWPCPSHPPTLWP